MLEVRDLTIRRGDARIHAPDLDLAAGETLAVTGPSGVGKTSLLLALAGLLRPESGVARLDGQDVWRLPASARARLRGERIGYVFASFHLIDALSVIDNLRLARVCAGGPERDATARARALLERLGLDGLERRRADRLSQGQMQRVALARALMNQPSLLLCDEPTAALDDDSAQALIGLLLESAAEAGAALVVATHDPRMASAAARSVRLEKMEAMA